VVLHGRHPGSRRGAYIMRPADHAERDEGPDHVLGVLIGPAEPRREPGGRRVEVNHEETKKGDQSPGFDRTQSSTVRTTGLLHLALLPGSLRAERSNGLGPRGGVTPLAGPIGAKPVPDQPAPGSTKRRSHHDLSLRFRWLRSPWVGLVCSGEGFVIGRSRVRVPRSAPTNPATSPPRRRSVAPVDSYADSYRRPCKATHGKLRFLGSCIILTAAAALPLRELLEVRLQAHAVKVLAPEGGPTGRQ
jgi:hypothetical protein